MKTYWQNYIYGAWVDGRAGRIDVIDPGTGEKLAEQALADALARRADKAPELTLIMMLPAAPEDIAAVIEFLLGEQANYVTGAIIPADGGTRAAFIPPAVQG